MKKKTLQFILAAIFDLPQRLALIRGTESTRGRDQRKGDTDRPGHHRALLRSLTERCLRVGGYHHSLLGEQDRSQANHHSLPTSPIREATETPPSTMELVSPQPLLFPTPEQTLHYGTFSRPFPMEKLPSLWSFPHSSVLLARRAHAD